jgi:hypothetical protein
MREESFPFKIYLPELGVEFLVLGIEKDAFGAESNFYTGWAFDETHCYPATLRKSRVNTDKCEAITESEITGMFISRIRVS